MCDIRNYKNFDQFLSDIKTFLCNEAGKILKMYISININSIIKFDSFTMGCMNNILQWMQMTQAEKYFL